VSTQQTSSRGYAASKKGYEQLDVLMCAVGVGVLRGEVLVE
jgi:hypothetical protein